MIFSYALVQLKIISVLGQVTIKSSKALEGAND